LTAALWDKPGIEERTTLQSEAFNPFSGMAAQLDPQRTFEDKIAAQRYKPRRSQAGRG